MDYRPVYLSFNVVGDTNALRFAKNFCRLPRSLESSKSVGLCQSGADISVGVNLLRTRSCGGNALVLLGTNDIKSIALAVKQKGLSIKKAKMTLRGDLRRICFKLISRFERVVYVEPAKCPLLPLPPGCREAYDSVHTAFVTFLHSFQAKHPTFEVCPINSLIDSRHYERECRGKGIPDFLHLNYSGHHVIWDVAWRTARPMAAVANERGARFTRVGWTRCGRAVVAGDRAGHVWVLSLGDLPHQPRLPREALLQALQGCVPSDRRPHLRDKIFSDA